MPFMEWEVEYTDEFEDWWETLTEGAQEDVDGYVRHLIQRGPGLPFPYSSGVMESRHGHIRELRVQSSGTPASHFLCV